VRESSVVVLDFEGTSKLASSRVTEIGLVGLNNDLTPKFEFETLINPPVPPESSSLAFSRISRKELAVAPSFKEIWPQFASRLNQNLIVSHNRIYEINVLRNELFDLSVSKLPPFICTLEWSRKILSSKVPNHQLSTLCDYFGIELTHAHEAISDARATAQLFAELALLSDELQESIQRMQEQVVTFEITKLSEVKLVTRERFQALNSNSQLVEIAFKRVQFEGRRLVVVTGTPDVGKEDFGKLASEVALEYRETPPTKATAFVVQANNAPGMSKIRRAQELNIPVLSEQDALILISKLKG
jgi:DNA polymerase III epsilon subunit-like protein